MTSGSAFCESTSYILDKDEWILRGTILTFVLLNDE